MRLRGLSPSAPPVRTNGRTSVDSGNLKAWAVAEATLFLAWSDKGSALPGQYCQDQQAPVSTNSKRTQTRQHVIIVGAGPVGLVTANLLADEGVAVSLVETCTDLPRDLRASTFPPTLDMSERFGVVAPMIEQGSCVHVAISRSHRGRRRHLRTLAPLAGY